MVGVVVATIATTTTKGCRVSRPESPKLSTARTNSSGIRTERRVHERRQSYRRSGAGPVVLLSLALLSGVFGAGLFVAHYEIYPFSELQKVTKYIRRTIDPSIIEGPWAIGLYTGKGLFELSADEQRPVIVDGPHAKGTFVGDPFIFEQDDTYFLFYEVLDPKTKNGEIAYSTSKDLRNWEYGSRVVQEPFHLSYPQVFKHNGETYLVPESHADLSVRLYKATDFPSQWTLESKLMSGFGVVDPTLFQHDGLWWMFVTSGSNNSNLNLFFSEQLKSGWQPHPKNPIVRKNRKIARSAGRVIEHDGELVRFAQDGTEYYGVRVFAVNITKLSTTEYEETPNFDKPVVDRTGEGWNAAGMHHVDFVIKDGTWYAITDGKFRI